MKIEMGFYFLFIARVRNKDFIVCIEGFELLLDVQ